MQDILKAGLITFESLKRQKPQQATQYFSKEEKAITELNPYLLKFITKIVIENRSKIVRESKTILPTLFSMCLATVIKFFNNSERNLV